uniref:Uncharacterized protein n=1 Tax=Salix viminalis TaxID=40686 RepID=A0A6N2NIA9_SALVM
MSCPLCNIFHHHQESNALVDKFVMDILHYTSAVSDYCVMPEETVMVGDASTSFIFRNGDNSLIHLAHTCYFQVVALVFARDRYKPEGIGEIQFHVTMSKGVMPFGPKLEAASVLLKDSECSWISAKLEGQNGIVAAGEILNDLKQQFRDADMSADIYIGVTKETIRTNDSGILIPGRCLDFYEVRGGGGRYFNVHGVDIRPGDSFLFCHSDSETASSTCDHAFNRHLTLKAELKSKNHLHLSKFADKDEKKEVLEIGRGPKSLMNEEDEDENSHRCCLHVYSTIYLVMS